MIKMEPANREETDANSIQSKDPKEVKTEEVKKVTEMNTLK